MLGSCCWQLQACSPPALQELIKKGPSCLPNLPLSIYCTYTYIYIHIQLYRVQYILRIYEEASILLELWLAGLPWRAPSRAGAQAAEQRNPPTGSFHRGDSFPKDLSCTIKPCNQALFPRIRVRLFRLSSEGICITRLSLPSCNIYWCNMVQLHIDV